MTGYKWDQRVVSMKEAPGRVIVAFRGPALRWRLGALVRSSPRMATLGPILTRPGGPGKAPSIVGTAAASDLATSSSEPRFLRAAGSSVCDADSGRIDCR